MTLSREAILASHDLPTDYVDAPLWGGRVKVKACPVGARDYTAYIDAGEGDQEKIRRMHVAAAIKGAINEDGTPLFTWDDADALREKHYNTIVAIANKSWELAATGNTTIADVDEGKGGSGTTPETATSTS